MNISNLLYRGGDYQTTEHIRIRQPTIGEIFDFGEDRYYSLLSSFVSTPFDMIVPLDRIKIDFTKITSYQLFCMLARALPKSETEILFGETDFRKFRLVYGNDGNAVLTDGKSFIDESAYMLISEYLRKMNNLKTPKYKKVGNEATKKKLIEYAYDDLKKAARKKQESQIQNCISYCVAMTNGRYAEVWEMPVYVFFDTVKRLNAVKHTEILYSGLYSGCMDLSKINKKELDFMRSLDK